MNELVFAICHELELQNEYLQGEQIETIYFGGGTPSLLSHQQLESIFSAIHKNYKVSSSPEITLESNPDDITVEKCNVFKSLGINRLSLGIQSFDDEVLKSLNRAHKSLDAINSISLLREFEFNNISIDLIHSIPFQSESILRENIKQALKLKPEHISVYSLTIEEKTVFGKWAAKGRFSPVEESESANQFELVMDTLIENGYQHYEISNFSLPGYRSRHNSSYWEQKKYLGVGPSAHSFNGETRQFNISNNHLYVKALNQDQLPAEIEHLTRENKINEYIFTSIRTQEGCNMEYVRRSFDYDLQLNQGSYIQQLIKAGYVSVYEETLKLTRAGKLLADKIAADLFTS